MLLISEQSLQTDLCGVLITPEHLQTTVLKIWHKTVKKYLYLVKASYLLILNRSTDLSS